MRISLFLVVISTLQILAGNSYSQSTRLTLDMKNVTIKDVLAQIEDKSDFYFLYDNSLIDVHKKVDLVVKNEQIDVILDKLFGKGKVNASIKDRHIILTPLEVSIQQSLKISGKVSDSSGSPLPGVTVIVKSTTQGTITDADGKYMLSDVPGDAMLIFSFVGMKTQEIPVSGKTNINVIMAEDAIGIDEVVAIGYGTQKKSDLTGAVIRIDRESFRNQPTTQISDMLAGTVAGLYSQQGTSASGGGSLEIRGAKSLNASTNPMLVVDGAIFNGSMSDLNPADIETIDILKDASSAAVFGARAAAGVILVTTKKGEKGKPTVNFSASVGVTSPTSDFRPYEGSGYMQFRKDYLKLANPNLPSYYYDDPANLPAGVSLEDWRNSSNNPQADNTDEYLSRLNFFQIEQENFKAGDEINWYDKVVNSGIRQNYDLSVSGATDKVNYYYSIGYQDNEGIVTGDEFKTIRARLKFDLNVTEWLDVGINAQLADKDQGVVKANLNTMFIMSPYGSMYEDDGSVKWYPNTFAIENPLINYYEQDRLMKATNLFASMYANIKLPFGIEYKISYQPRYTFSKDYNFWPSTTVIGGATHSQGYGTRSETTNFEWMLDHLIHWEKQIGAHNFDLSLLYSAEENKYWSTFNSNETFVPNENLGFNGLQYGTKPYVSNNDQRVTGDAAMARLNYDLLGKYLVTASIRRDGYSAFGQMNPRATFPAAAFAWKISKEDFFNVAWISQLKARVSWGVNGNRSIGAYSALAQLSPNFYYDGTNVQVGVYNNSLANSSLVWERTESFNVGFDLGIFDNRVSVAAEYYNATTNDLLMERKLPKITGFTSIMTNLGELGNKGIELTVNSVNVNNSNFSWRSNLVFSFNRNKIKELFGDYEEVEIDGETVRKEIPDYSNEWFPGRAIDAVWNYDVLGVWQENEAAEAEKYGLKPGDFKVDDVDNNYTYTALDDKKFIGFTKPRYNFGLKNDFTFLKNFTASFFIRADLGQIGYFSQAYRRGGDTYDKRNCYDLPYWTPENPINDYARLDSDFSAYGGGMQIFKPRSFVRLQDISLSYQVPANTCRNMKINSMRIFASARNLLTFSKWPGWDPEASDNGPMPKITTIGINISL